MRSKCLRFRSGRRTNQGLTRTKGTPGRPGPGGPAMRRRNQIGPMSSLIARAGYVLLCAIAFGAAVGWTRAADTPAVPTSPAAGEAPWRRLLTGDDAKRAGELWNKLTDLRRAGKY